MAGSVDARDRAFFFRRMVDARLSPVGPVPPASADPPESHVFPRRGKIPSLDGWRALAILVVLISRRVTATRYPAGARGRLDDIFDGKFGVRIFFVISGLLITFLLLREAHETGGISLRSFYVRRALRILPVYYVYLGVLALLTVLGCYHDSLASWVCALTFTRDFGGAGYSGTVHFWSLAIEEQFYLAWPLCFVGLALWKKPRLYAALLSLVIAAGPFLRAHAAAELSGSWRSHLLSPLSICMYVDSLAVGCLGAWAAWHWRARRWHPAALGAVVVAALLVIVEPQALWGIPAGAAGLMRDVAPTLQAFAILLLIGVSVQPASGWLRRGLNARWVVWLGALSYSLYVWHMLFLGTFIGEPMAGWPTHDFRWWYAGAFAAACLSYYGLERPILRIKSRLRPGRHVVSAPPVPPDEPAARIPSATGHSHGATPL